MNRNSMLRKAANKLRSYTGGSGPSEAPAAKKPGPELPEREAALRERLKEARWALADRDRELSELRARLDEAKPQASPSGAASLVSGESSPPPFFILGPPKSGTTWLMAVLNSHPEILCAGEGQFFGRDLKTENPYGQWGAGVSAAMTGLGGESADFDSLHGALAGSRTLKRWFNSSGRWTEKEDTERHMRAVVRLSADYVFAQALAKSGKRIAGDKSPSHIQYLEEMAEFYPKAKVVHIIRDGRDQAVSSAFHWWRHAQDLGGFFPLSEGNIERRDAYYENKEAFGADKRSIFDEASVRAFAGHWREVVDNAREKGPRLFDGRYFEVKYEDLQETPEKLFAEVIEFLGAEADEETMAEIVVKNSFEAKSKRKLGEENPKAFLRSGKAGDWKRHFTERDRRIYEEEAGELLSELGYEL